MSEHAERLVILSDDLTGQLGLASALRAVGLAAGLVPEHLGRSAISVLNTRSRDVGPAIAERRVAAAIRECSSLEGVRWAKRVDSLLYGSVIAEIEQFLQLTRVTSGVLAPAHPLAGRRSQDGHLFHGEKWVADLRSFLPTGREVKNIVVGDDAELDPGTWWLPDITCQDDLARVACQIPLRSDVLTVDSGALTAATCAAGSTGIVEAPAYSPPAPQPSRQHVVVVQGSASALVEDQINFLRRAGLEELTCYYRPTEGPADLKLRHLAHLAGEQLRDRDVCAVIVGGGLTAEALFDAAGIPMANFRPMPTTYPLVGLAEVDEWHHEPLLVATKGGQVGTESTLVDLVKLVRGQDSSPAPDLRPASANQSSGSIAS